MITAAAISLLPRDLSALRMSLEQISPIRSLGYLSLFLSDSPHTLRGQPPRHIAKTKSSYVSCDTAPPYEPGSLKSSDRETVPFDSPL